MNKNRYFKTFGGFFVMLFCLFLFQPRCSSECSSKMQIEKYEEIMSKGAQYVNDFFMAPKTDSSYLDSALLYLNTAAKYECSERDIILYNKAFIYFQKRDFEKAIERIDSIDTESFALMKSIIIEKIKAKHAELEGDAVEQKKRDSNIVEKIDQYLTLNQLIFDSIMRLSDKTSIWNDSRFAGLHYMQLYHSTKVIGADRTNRALDSLQRLKGYNRAYIDELKKDVDGWASGQITGHFPFD